MILVILKLECFYPVLLILTSFVNPPKRTRVSPVRNHSLGSSWLGYHVSQLFIQFTLSRAKIPVFLLWAPPYCCVKGPEMFQFGKTAWKSVITSFRMNCFIVTFICGIEVNFFPLFWRSYLWNSISRDYDGKILLENISYEETEYFCSK